jgi:hypothetical protein
VTARPSALSAAVLPPVFGPVMTILRVWGATVKSIGTIGDGSAAAVAAVDVALRVKPACPLATFCMSLSLHQQSRTFLSFIPALIDLSGLRIEHEHQQVDDWNLDISSPAVQVRCSSAFTGQTACLAV